MAESPGAPSFHVYFYLFALFILCAVFLCLLLKAEMTLFFLKRHSFSISRIRRASQPPLKGSSFIYSNFLITDGSSEHGV